MKNSDRDETRSAIDRNHRPPGHPTTNTGRIGVLLVNLGTPDATDYWSVRRYLKEFLSDRRVVEAPRIVWWPLLNGIILSTRPQKSGALYKTIWNEELDESPLRTITRSHAEKLAADMAGTDARIIVDWAMRYGTPAIGDRLENLMKAGAERILVAPLYPQYSAATTATVNDRAFAALAKMRWQPAIRTLPPYHDDPIYIEALADSIRDHLAALSFEPDVVLASFHGLPKAYLDKGDPYHCHCQKTVRLLREVLGWDAERLPISFQSRLGHKEWLQPYTDQTVENLAKSGVRRLVIVTPGFSADCLETLEEIAGQNAEIFKENAGESFSAIPCLNDTELGMRVIRTLVTRELSGWI